MRILFVEDHDAFRRALTRLLVNAGHEVTAVATADEALAACDARPFDLILSDIGLPDMDGWEMLGRLRRCHPVRAIAISAFSSPSDRERSRAAGFQAHLVKPVEWETLEATIAEVVT